MLEKTHPTRCGIIHYWISKIDAPEKPSLIFLPGLTADHRLFEKQIEYFEGKYSLLVWDAPGHNLSRPFTLNFSLTDKAGWLDEILIEEAMPHPVLIGQSMGGYVSQAYMQRFPGKLSGFISIDSAPLQRVYMKNWEIAALKKIEPVYRWYPWKALLRSGSKGTAETEYGRALMRKMMQTYADDPKEYAALAGHGYRMLAEAIEADLPYRIDCPVLLICGEKDKAGEAKLYNKKWTKRAGLPLEMIPEAGHNANTDRPDLINPLIERFIGSLSL